MSAMVAQTATPLESVPGLGEGLVEKLNAAGVSTVEALADMTPEQLEAIEGIGPKTVEKISLAVNNYFASLEQGAAVEGEVVADGEVAVAETPEAGAEDITAEAGAEDITAEVPAATEEGTVEADALAAGENEGQAEASGEQPEPEAESTSETRE